MNRSRADEIGRLADQLNRSFHGGAWHGPATREVLDGIDAARASRRPQGSPHSIAELACHIAFWLNAAHVRISSGRDVDSDSDWRVEGTLSDDAWGQVIAELEQAHAKLRVTLLDLDDDRLDDPVPGSDPTIRGLLLGTLQHNAYHTGQIVQIARELEA